jgi:hypothetical protein
MGSKRVTDLTWSVLEMPGRGQIYRRHCERGEAIHSFLVL